MIRTAGEMIAAMEHLPLRSFDDLEAQAILVIAPHADDESLGCGGLIRAARDRDIPVSIVVVSDGTGSHPNSNEYPRERLRALREAEVRAAALELGVLPDAMHFLRIPDGFVPSEGPCAEVLWETIADLIAASRIDFVAVTWDGDPHCDHKAAYTLARSACLLAGVPLHAYPIWGLSLPPQTPLAGRVPKGFRLAIDAELPAKRKAIKAHVSQTTGLIDDDPEGFMLAADMIARFDRPWEIFLEVPQ